MESCAVDQVVKVYEKLDGLQPQSILEWALKEFGDRVALACSFGAEDMVLVDMLAKIDRQARIFLLDTGRLHQETYDLMDRTHDKLGTTFEVYSPQTDAVERLLSIKGPNSFYQSVKNRKECCYIRKVEPLNRALSTVDAWITGLRRSQSVTRSSVATVEIDDTHNGILKISPLVEWSEEDVWRYIRENKVPYHQLHDKGFPSIGCAPCTRAVQPGEDIRAGRWWWEDPEHKECGLHIKETTGNR